MSADRPVVQDLLGQVIRDRDLRNRLERDPAGTLADYDLAPADRARLLDAAIPRLLAYHEMVHSRLFRTIKAFIGGAAQHIGDDRLHADVRRWLGERGPRSAYLRDAPREFMTWVEPAWDVDEAVPAWVIELASHQILTRELRNSPAEVGAATESKIDLEAPILCNATTQVLRYRYAVHRMSREPGPDEVPDALEPGHAVVAFRAPDGRPRVIDIKPRSASMLERLLAGQTLREALFGACAALGETLDDQILSVTAMTLADLSERHVLLGGQT